MPTPEDFKVSASEGINQLSNGTYYFITPNKQGPTASSHVLSNPVILPFLDQAALVSNHNFSEGANFKKMIGQAGEWVFGSSLMQAGEYVASSSGYGAALEGAAVYNGSSPVTLNVRSKLFSVYGDGSVLDLLDKINASGYGTLSGGQSGGFPVQGGTFNHPGWFDIEIKSFQSSGGGEKVIYSFKNAVILSTNFTIYAPFIGQGEPMLVDIDIAFKQAFRGFRENVGIGKSI